MLPFLSGQTVAAAAIIAVAAVAPAPSVKAPVIRPAVASAASAHKIYGFVQSLSGETLVIQNRRGRMIVVDGSFAHSAVRLFRGRPVIVFGTQDANGIVHAKAVWRTYSDAAHWPADR
jgi:hypothetical protein